VYNQIEQTARHMYFIFVVLSQFDLLSKRTRNKASSTADSAPGVATKEVTLSAREVVPVSAGQQLVLLRTDYSQTQGCVCTALPVVGDVMQPWLMSKYDVINKTGST